MHGETTRGRRATLLVREAMRGGAGGREGDFQVHASLPPNKDARSLGPLNANSSCSCLLYVKVSVSLSIHLSGRRAGDRGRERSRWALTPVTVAVESGRCVSTHAPTAASLIAGHYCVTRVHARGPLFITGEQKSNQPLVEFLGSRRSSSRAGIPARLSAATVEPDRFVGTYVLSQHR